MMNQSDPGHMSNLPAWPVRPFMQQRLKPGDGNGRTAVLLTELVGNEPADEKSSLTVVWAESKPSPPRQAVTIIRTSVPSAERKLPPRLVEADRVAPFPRIAPNRIWSPRKPQILPVASAFTIQRIHCHATFVSNNSLSGDWTENTSDTQDHGGTFTMTQAVKRACDACHRRKVKCDGINPCRNCSSAQLSCTYNAIPQKKGPKGSRAKVISELRETQRQTSLSAKVQNRMSGIANPPTSPSMAPTPGLLTGELVKECVQFFFDNMYAQIPILDRRQVEQQILYMEQNRDAYCLLTSLCAFVMLQPGMTMPAGDPYNLDMIPGANIISSQLLVEETLRVRKGYEYLDSITLNALATNFFLFGCLYGQEMHDKAWYHLREASTMIHMIGMNKEEYLMQFDPAESSRRRRLYWLFFVLERAYGLQRQRPLTLQATINPPTLADDPTDPLAHQLNGFIMLVNIYRPFDDALTAMWNKSRGNLSAQYVTGLQKQLNDLVQTYLCQDSSFNDLRVNQQWLKNTTWQLTNGGVVNGNGEDSISFQYPMNMSRELLVNMASQFPGNGMDFMGSGLIERLVETVFSMTELLAIQPAPRDPFAVGPREYLTQILSIVAMARNGDYRFLPLLLSKVTEILPRIANPMLLNAPENANLANMDIFDGFGTAGMAQPPPQLQLPMDGGEYERKFPVEDYEKKYSMDMNGSTPESVTNSNSDGTPPVAQQNSDMGNSFVSSPAIMSPGMEYPHNMNNFSCTPMGEMVMNPLGNSAQQASMNVNQGQHGQQMNNGHENMVQHHMNNLAGQGMRTPSVSGSGMATPHQMHAMGGMRPPSQRQGSFHMPSQPSQMRSVSDFHRLQRARPEAQPSMVGMNSMNGELDFNTLR
ncbi:C6 zinc finger domain containing protein [Paramyrothecium foliicola]|nr:C6 zinc finger domain containing protein [Paramyrothecium foliicola]